MYKRQAFAGGTLIESINHGYLAVDFFFILSGFVIGYAYDDRWGKSLTVKNFFKRRLIRLHPMVVMGAVLGVITFCIQGSEQWDGTHVATSMVMWALLFAMFFIPAYPGAGYEVRGNGEMFPSVSYTHLVGSTTTPHRHAHRHRATATRRKAR